MRNPDTSQHNGIPKMKQALLIWIQLTHPTKLSSLHLGQWFFFFHVFSCLYCLYVKPPVSGVLTAHCWYFNHHSPLVSSSSLKSSSSMAWKSATLLSPSPQSRGHSPDFVAGLWAINIYGGYIYIYIDLNTHYTRTHTHTYIYNIYIYTYTIISPSKFRNPKPPFQYFPILSDLTIRSDPFWTITSEVTLLIQIFSPIVIKVLLSIGRLSGVVIRILCPLLTVEAHGFPRSITWDVHPIWDIGAAFSQDWHSIGW